VTSAALSGYRRATDERPLTGGHHSRLIKTPDRISERPPRGGLSFCALPWSEINQDYFADVGYWPLASFRCAAKFSRYWRHSGHSERPPRPGGSIHKYPRRRKRWLNGTSQGIISRTATAASCVRVSYLRPRPNLATNGGCVRRSLHRPCRDRAL
jgi:hypothetical protein